MQLTRTETFLRVRIGRIYDVGPADPESIAQSAVDPVAGRLRFNLGGDPILFIPGGLQLRKVRLMVK